MSRMCMLYMELTFGICVLCIVYVYIEGAISMVCIGFVFCGAVSGLCCVCVVSRYSLCGEYIVHDVSDVCLSGVCGTFV